MALFSKSNGGRMEKILGLIAIVITLNVNAGLTDFNCRLNEVTGDVYLVALNENNEYYMSFVGREKFVDPFKYRRQCEVLKQNTIDVSDKKWSSRGCVNGSYNYVLTYSMLIEKLHKVLTFEPFEATALNMKVEPNSDCDYY